MSRRQKFIWYFLLISTISFLLASLVASNKAFADTTYSQDYDFTRGSQSSVGAMTDVLFRIATTAPTLNYTRQGIGRIWADGNCTASTGVTITFYGAGLGSSSPVVANGGSVTAGSSCVWEWSTTSVSLCTNGCDIRLQSTGGTAIVSQGATYATATVIMVTPPGFESNSPWINLYTIGTPRGTSQGSVSTTSLLYPIAGDGLITNMNCINVSTGTNCTFAYASTTNLVTPQNLGFVLLWFVCGWIIGFGIVLLFSKRYR